MDTEPHNENNERRFERMDAHRRREELLGTLPPPKEAAGFITAMLSDDAREHILDAMSEGRSLDPITARLIAYNLIAQAPEGSSTDALYDFFLTGYGEYENLRSEYLPLYTDPIMPAEGRVLLDSLGTYLFNRENRRNTPAVSHLHASAVVIGTDRSGRLRSRSLTPSRSRKTSSSSTPPGCCASAPAKATVSAPTSGCPASIPSRQPSSTTSAPPTSRMWGMPKRTGSA